MRVVADDERLTGRVGTAAVARLADQLGLTAGLSKAVAGRTTRRSRVDGGRVLRDLVVMLVDGGDAVTDLGALRDQPELFGAVSSNATAHRVVAAIGADQLDAIGEARAATRARAWRLGAARERMVIDVDGSLVTSHSDKEQAAPTWKRGWRRSGRRTRDCRCAAQPTARWWNRACVADRYLMKSAFAFGETASHMTYG